MCYYTNIPVYISIQDVSVGQVHRTGKINSMSIPIFFFIMHFIINIYFDQIRFPREISFDEMKKEYFFLKKRFEERV